MDCFTWTPNQFLFNSKNFQERQTLTITRVKNGPETTLIPIFNGGGFDNHRIFWNNMKSNGGGEPTGTIADAIKTSFGSFSDFKEKFSSTTAVIQGSGWGWLVYNPSTNKVEYKSMPNQTSPRTEGLIPLLGCDVWEHAYYLKYQNKRPDYISAWWNVINWDDVSARYDKSKGK